MATFVFSTHAARGDVWPYLAIGHELQKRGHRAIIASSPSYRGAVEGHGLEFGAVRPDSPSGEESQRLMNPRSGTEWLFRRWLLPSLRDSIADLRAIASGADVLVTHTTSLAGPIVAELERARGLKWASSAVSPLALLRADAVLPAAPRAAHSPALNRTLWELLRRQFGLHLKETQTVRTELGLSRGENALWSDAHSPLLQLRLWDADFAYPPENIAQKTTGFCFLDDETPLSDEIRAFLDAGEAPLVFLAASFTDSDQWERESIAAADLLGRRAVLLGARHDSVSSTALSLRFAPLGPILPFSAALVHQGGIGTLALGLRARVPMLLCPRSHDQPDNARRAQKLGIARVIVPNDYRANAISREIRALWSDNELEKRVEHWQGRMAAQSGAICAADELEKITQFSDDSKK